MNLPHIKNKMVGERSKARDIYASKLRKQTYKGKDFVPMGDAEKKWEQ